MRNFIYIVVFYLSLIGLQAQELLTKDEALRISLEQNFDIKVSEKNTEIAKNNTSIYNSGYLPTANVNTGLGYSSNNSELKAQDGATIGVRDAASTNYNASVGLNYLLFDGMNRKYNFKKLKETLNLTELQARQVIENTLLNLYFSYFEVARLTENKQNQKKTLEISKRRLLRTGYSAEYGQSTKLDILNAEVDVNNDSINYLESKRQLLNSKRNLNAVLGRDVSVTSFNVETDVVYAINLNPDDVLTNALANNVLLLQVNKGIELSNYDILIRKSGWMPNVNLTGSYGWNKSINDQPVGFSFASNERYGLNTGVTLGWNIFDGGRTKTSVQNAKITLESRVIEKQQFTEELKRDVYNAWELYKNALFKLEVQRSNVETNKRNFERTNEQYKLGQVTSIDFRLAQINLLNAEQDVSTSKYEAKNAEFQLMYLSGDLLNN